VAAHKVYPSPAAAVADVFDGATVLIGGFAGGGVPRSLIRALIETGAKDLMCVYSASDGQPSEAQTPGVPELVAAGLVRKLISPLPFYPGADDAVEQQWKDGQLEIEVVPQGLLAERLRAGGAGLGGVFLSTGTGTRFSEGKEVRSIGGREYHLEMSITADFALIRGDKADSLGNTTYRGTGRNWGPVMAMSASVAVVEVDQICEPGDLDPELVITPGIFVNRIVRAVE
jgi:3-oxoacid CoA-transferase A subunit